MKTLLLYNTAYFFTTFFFLSFFILLMPKIVPRNNPMASKVSEISSAGKPSSQILSIVTINSPNAGKTIAITHLNNSYTS